MVSPEDCVDTSKGKGGRSSSNSRLVMSTVGKEDFFATATGSVASRVRRSPPRKAALVAHAALDSMRDGEEVRLSPGRGTCLDKTPLNG